MIRLLRSRLRQFSRYFRPERPFLSAQAEGLGVVVAEAVALKGPFNRIPIARRRTTLSGSTRYSVPTPPGLWPGLTETAFQAENPAPRCQIAPRLALALFNQRRHMTADRFRSADRADL